MPIILQHAVPQSLSETIVDSKKYDYDDALKTMEKKIDSQKKDRPQILNETFFDELKIWLNQSPLLSENYISGESPIPTFKGYISDKIQESIKKGFDFIREFNKVVNHVLRHIVKDISDPKFSLKAMPKNSAEFKEFFKHMHYASDIFNKIESWNMDGDDLSYENIYSRFYSKIIDLKDKYNIKEPRNLINNIIESLVDKKNEILNNKARYVADAPFKSHKGIFDELDSYFIDKLKDNMLTRVQEIFDKYDKASEIQSELDLWSKIFSNDELKKAPELLISFNNYILKGISSELNPFIKAPGFMRFVKAKLSAEYHSEDEIIYHFSFKVVIGVDSQGDSSEEKYRYVTKDIVVQKMGKSALFENKWFKLFKDIVNEKKPDDINKLLRIAASLKASNLEKILDHFKGNPEAMFKLLRDKRLLALLKNHHISIDEFMEASETMSKTVKYTLIGIAATLGLVSTIIWATGIRSARTNKRLMKNNKKYKYKSTRGMVITSALLGLLSLSGSVALMTYIFIVKGGL